MNRPLIAILLILVVVVGYFELSKSPIVDKDKAIVQTSVFAVPIAELTEVSLVKSEQSIAFSAVDKTWRATSGGEVDQLAIKAALEQLLKLEVVDSAPFEETEGVADPYGLEPPQVVIALKTKSSKAVASFGKLSPLSDRRYLQLEGESKVLLVNEASLQAITKAIYDSRIRRPLLIKVEDVKSLSVVKDGVESLVLTRVANGWNAGVSGKFFKAEPKVVERALKTLLETEAQGLHGDSDGLVLYGLAAPLATVGLGFNHPDSRGRTSATIHFGKGLPLQDTSDVNKVAARNNFYMMLSGDKNIYRYVRPVFGEMLQSPEYYKSRKPFEDLNWESIVTATVKSKTNSCSFEKIQTTAEFESFKKLLSEFDVLAFIDLATIPEVEQPSLNIELLTESKSRPAVAQFKVLGLVNSAQGTSLETAPYFCEIVVGEEHVGAIVSSIEVGKLNAFCAK